MQKFVFLVVLSASPSSLFEKVSSLGRIQAGLGFTSPVLPASAMLLGVMVLNQYRVLSSRAVKPCPLYGVRYMARAVRR